MDVKRLDIAILLVYFFSLTTMTLHGLCIHNFNKYLYYEMFKSYYERNDVNELEWKLQYNNKKQLSRLSETWHIFPSNSFLGVLKK